MTRAIRGDIRVDAIDLIKHIERRDVRKVIRAAAHNWLAAFPKNAAENRDARPQKKRGVYPLEKSANS